MSLRFRNRKDRNLNNLQKAVFGAAFSFEPVVEPILEKFLGPHHSDSSEETDSQTTGINSTIFSDLYI